MGKFRPRLSSPQERLREEDGFFVALQVSLHDRIAQRCSDRRLHEIWITVAKSMHTDAGDEIQFHRTVCQLNQRPTPKS